MSELSGLSFDSSTRKYFRHRVIGLVVFIFNPADHFPNLDPRNMSVGHVSQLHKIGRLTDFDAQTLGNVMSGKT